MDDADILSDRDAVVVGIRLVHVDERPGIVLDEVFDSRKETILTSDSDDDSDVFGPLDEVVRMEFGIFRRLNDVIAIQQGKIAVDGVAFRNVGEGKLHGCREGERMM